MSERIHLAIAADDKERYRQAAERERKTLSVWLREAAEEKWSAAQERRALDTREELAAFFESRDAQEVGHEPAWSEHQSVIEESRASGRGPAT